MVKIYDVVTDSELHPSLTELLTLNVDSNLMNKKQGLDDLFNALKLDCLDNERVFLVSLDMYSRLMGVYLIGLGDYKGSKFYNRHIATVLLLSGARKFFVIHNHPDGALSLSEDDNTMVVVMMTLAKILEIEFMSSYVVTRDGYISNTMDKPIKFKRR